MALWDGSEIICLPIATLFPKMELSFICSRDMSNCLALPDFSCAGGPAKGTCGGGADKRQLPHFSPAISSSYLAPALMQSSSQRPLSLGVAVPKEEGAVWCPWICLCNIWGPWAVLGCPVSGEWKGSLFPSSCPAVSAETLPGAPCLGSSANLPNASLSLNGKKQLLKSPGALGRRGGVGPLGPAEEEARGPTGGG